MRVAVLGSPESWYLTDLRRAAGTRHEVLSVPFRQLSSGVGCAHLASCTSGGANEANGPNEAPPADDDFITASSAGLDLGPENVDAVLVRSMPPGTLEQVVFRMDVLGRLEKTGQVVVNPPRSMETAIDKFLATALLRAAGLAVPRTVACQTPEDALAAFHALGGDVVVKPLFGGEGRGITRLDDEALADRAFRMLCGLGAVIYLQEFIPHESYDVRVLVVGGQMFAMRRRNEHDWRTNVSRGAQTEPVELTGELAKLATAAAKAVGAPLAGVDLLPGPDGHWYVLEVNAVPGWRAMSRTLEKDIAAAVLEFLVSEVELARESWR